MWGTRTRYDIRNHIFRFIPTHVGNTLAVNCLIVYPPVHPHACGEHWTNPENGGYCTGSSPRMWGTQALPSGQLRRLRFIPTHVGNTQFPGIVRKRHSVHPHACGEHFTDIPPVTLLYGSSPRMWGTPLAHGIPNRVGRFIPTHVGNTFDRTTVETCTPVHPHACGEHHSVSFVHDYSSGSSPRMWGTLHP